MRPQFDLYKRNYHSLSVRDLLEARDAYHVYLAHLDNVFATAIGLFRIREDDADAEDYTATKHAAQKRGEYTTRRLDNTVVRPWSWPCVLVFVSNWLKPEEAAKQRDRLVPPFLFMPDGRVVPVCVIEAPLEDRDDRTLNPTGFSGHRIGGGYPVLSVVQGREHIGSLGCVVTDGNAYYALTNQHVAGPAGQETYTIINGKRHRIGVSAPLSLRDVPFAQAYEGLPGAHTRSNLDVGLIRMDDMAQWTAQILGLGELGTLVDFNGDTATLDWLGTPVVAFGGASGKLTGEIQALFYRYRTVGGTDYVSDFLIGGRPGEVLATRPGDSGTLWCVDPDGAEVVKGKKAAAEPRTFRPIAMEWGGQRMIAGTAGNVAQFALATSVAVACRELDVDIVRDWNVGHSEYWGAVGHYKIAQMACVAVSAPLRNFLEANLEAISYAPDNIDKNKIKRDPTHFVPLADVPDIVWKTNMNHDANVNRPQENWQHYADMDMPGADGVTLLDLCGHNPTRLDLQAWKDFYQNAAPLNGKPVNQGSLPFRVWQIFDEMLAFRAADDEEKFVCAAGILAHYVGDSCQPLHSSMHSDGLNGSQTGVHSTYEEKMIDAFSDELRTKLDDFLASNPAPAAQSIANGHDAAAAVVDLIRRTHANLPPEHICEVYNGLGGGQSKATIAGLWSELADATVTCIADGLRTLAALWESAYQNGAGNTKFSGGISTDALQTIYEKKNFLESLHLAHLDPAKYVAPAGAGNGSKPKLLPKLAATATKKTHTQKHKTRKRA